MLVINKIAPRPGDEFQCKGLHQDLDQMLELIARAGVTGGTRPKSSVSRV
jgi:hypothetical protein